MADATAKNMEGEEGKVSNGFLDVTIPEIYLIITLSISYSLNVKVWKVHLV